MGIMNVLAELHQEHDLKVSPSSLILNIRYFPWNWFYSLPHLLQLNLKFEIEVLCKNLSLDISELKPGNLLRDKEKLKNLEEQLSAPKKETKPPEEMLPIVTTGRTVKSLICEDLFPLTIFVFCCTLPCCLHSCLLSNQQ